MAVKKQATKKAAAKKAPASKAVAKSSAAKKAAPSKAAAKKVTAKKTAPGKAAAKKAPAKRSTGFTAEERAAMRERAGETKSASGEREVLAKIAEMPSPDRSMAKRFHAIVMAAAPDLSPRTWYGMPAYAKAGDIICFFQNKQKFKSRYATFGFNDGATLDDGVMWPTSYALTEMTPAAEKTIAGLVKKAAR